MITGYLVAMRPYGQEHWDVITETFHKTENAALRHALECQQAFAGQVAVWPVTDDSP